MIDRSDRGRGLSFRKVLGCVIGFTFISDEIFLVDLSPAVPGITKSCLVSSFDADSVMNGVVISAVRFEFASSACVCLSK